ncbi:hypothetical protein AAIR98_000473 [Elusimicrobium simillimum]|uniref:SurA N-terminal domain-containing protein n=1 Tax=Elusimicrobium simillimum TaxID=3143438 RepID=UPI003C704D3D
MISLLGKYKKIILVVVISCFLGSIFYLGYGAVSGSVNANSTVAIVGTENIPAYQYNRLLRAQEMQFRSLGIDMEENTLNFLKQRVLQTLLFESAMVQTAAKYGLFVSDYELASTIHSSPSFNFNGLFDKKAYVWTVRNQLGMTTEEYENQERRNILMNRMGQMVVSAFKTTPQELKYNFKSQYGSVKDFDKKAAEFTPTVMETKALAAQNFFLSDYNSNNNVKVLLQE